MAEFDRIHWLLGGDDHPLRTSVLLGDQIGLGTQSHAVEWFAPAESEASAQGTGILMLPYQSQTRAIAFCIVKQCPVRFEDLQDLRYRASLAYADRIWRPFVNRLGSSVAPIAGDLWHEKNLAWKGAFWRVRRPRHANFLIDRLMSGEREQAIAAFDRLLSSTPVAASAN